jgi:hypothetical protein
MNRQSDSETPRPHAGSRAAGYLHLPRPIPASAMIPLSLRAIAEAEGFEVQWADGQFCRIRRPHPQREPLGQPGMGGSLNLATAR